MQNALLSYTAPPLISMSPADEVTDSVDEDEELIEKYMNLPSIGG